MNRFFLTTPLYYVNARPHLGHVYSTMVADVLVRFHRQMGETAEYLTGTDEHGQKIQRAAQAAGISPQAFADANAARFRQEWERLGLQYSYFIRTTEARHAAAVVEIFHRLRKNGAIYKGGYSGAYCVYDELYADVQPGEPCPECGRPTESLTEENYYFRLSDYADRLLALYRDQPDFIRPESRRNEVLAFVQGGLKDLSISRTSIHWGIPVPGDERHVFYVWLDALVGYLSGLGFGSPAASDREALARNWPAWHLVGKEIVRFHAVYWPAFLMAAGLELPRGIIAHGWLLFEEEKMSKSRGNVVRAEPIRQVLGADALRYFLLREVSFGQDGAFSYDALLGRYNSDLANGWGNLAARTLSMIARYCAGRVPAPAADANWLPGDGEIRGAALAARDALREHFLQYQFSRGLEAVWQLIAALNRYIVETQPWVLAEKTDAEAQARLRTVLYVAAEGLRILAVLLASVLPDSAARLWAQLGLPGDAAQRLDTLTWGQLPAGQAIAHPESGASLFPRVDKAPAIVRLRQLEADLDAESGMAATSLISETKPMEPNLDSSLSAPETPAPLAATITIDDFAKVDLRVGEIKTAERIPGATRLLKLTVDIGLEIRQIVAGIAEVYDPASLPGRKVVIAANLAPRKLRGVESNGMIIAASLGEHGKPALISVPEDTPLGARLR